ncbi:MAG: UDP-N-acetylmuramoyl-tripeptide--D-alanyl-D-alanine ligase [Vicinamibacterales bacterium]
MTAATVVHATGGRLRSGQTDQVIGGVSIDSRTVAAGDLFFAIVAVRDGHTFVADALARGAVGAVLNAASDGGMGGVEAPILIEVADTTRALQDLARHVRRESHVTVIAVTGSAGKTTTKEAIASVLSSRYRVVRNRGNLNNHLGLPLSLLELGKKEADVAVMELGMNHAGEIRVLVGIAEPDVRVWTNVGEAHLGSFGTVEAVADAKAEILEQATADTVLVCSADDDRITTRRDGFPGRTVTFGERAGADVRAVDVEPLGLRGSRARVITGRGEIDLRVPLVGRGNLANALCAVAVGVEMNIPTADIVERIAALEAAPRRGAVTHLTGGVTLIDDSYNASPSAMRQALAVVGAETAARRRGAVLGEMLELGEGSRALHEEIGRLAATLPLDRLITVGGEPARALGIAAIEAGLPRVAVTHRTSSEQAGEDIVGWLEPGDIVLVKGSRGIRTDIVAERIAAEFA